jgi:hypothetical protein
MEDDGEVIDIINNTPKQIDLSKSSKQGFQAFAKGLRSFTKAVEPRSSAHFENNEEEEEEEEADQIPGEMKSPNGMVVCTPLEESQPSQ